MTKDELFKMIKISNIKRKDIVLDCGQHVRRYTAIIEGLRVNHESDGICRSHLSVYEFINLVKREYIIELVCSNHD
jgi:hypothetical protein